MAVFFNGTLALGFLAGGFAIIVKSTTCVTNRE